MPQKNKQADIKMLLGLEPKAAVEYMQNKGYKVTGDWREMWQDAHAKAFTIAKMTNIELLKESKSIINQAIKEGWSNKQAEKALKDLYKAKGWLAGKTFDDDKEAKQYMAQRVRTIFRTNANVAYNTGRYLQQMEDVNFAPYWEYKAVLDERTRPAHKDLDGKIFRYDDPFLGAFYPPNGWGCRCYVNSVSNRALGNRKVEKSGKSLSSEEVVINEDTGETKPRALYKVDMGGIVRKVKPDAGWSYNPGTAAYNIDVLAYNSVKDMSQPIKDKFISEMAQNPHKKESYEIFMKNLLKKDYKAAGVEKVVSWISPDVLSFLGKENLIPQTPVIVCQQKTTHFLVTKQAEQVITAQQMTKLYEIINNPDGVYLDTKNDALIYTRILKDNDVQDGRDCLKIAIKLNKTKKGVPVNYIATPARVKLETITKNPQYKKAE